MLKIQLPILLPSVHETEGERKDIIKYFASGSKMPWTGAFALLYASGQDHLLIYKAFTSVLHNYPCTFLVCVGPADGIRTLAGKAHGLKRNG